MPFHLYCAVSSICAVSRVLFRFIFRALFFISLSVKDGAVIKQHEYNGGNTSSSGGGGGGDNGNKLEVLLATLLAGGVRGGGVPGPGHELEANGLRFVRPVDEHMSLNDVPVTPLLVSESERLPLYII